MKKLPLVLAWICLAITLPSYGQFTDDFSDGELASNPTWSGAVDSFMVNASQELQLNATTGGASTIYTQYLAEDSLEWELYLMMEFAPSASNAAKILLSLDDADIDLARGYYLQIGASGSDDAIRLYRAEIGSDVLLGEASMGAVSSDPAIARIKVIYSPTEKMWTLLADYGGGNNLEEEFSIVDGMIPVSGNRFFGLECSYTSTRVDKFFFDDISVMTWSAGNPPSLVSYDLISGDSLVLHFDKILSSENNGQVSRVTIDGVNVASLEVNSQNPNTISVKLQQAISGSAMQELCAEGITDNGSQGSLQECLDVIFISTAIVGDLYINEILFNPPSSASDFVELVNVTDRFISLENIIIANAYNEQSKPIGSDIIIAPGAYLALTKEVDELVDYYDPPAPFSIVQQDLPAYNVADGNVWIYYEEGGDKITIDSFDYFADFHYALLDDVKGVSLEKVSPESETNDANSWHSAGQDVGFATPGYANSNQIEIVSQESPIFLHKKTFSPNGDNRDDFLVIGFNLDNPGYVANIKIYNDRGYLVRYLSNNVLLGTNSIVQWDGLTNDGIRADIGIYIVLSELFDLNGNKIQSKEACVLADFLD